MMHCYHPHNLMNRHPVPFNPPPWGSYDSPWAAPPMNHPVHYNLSYHNPPPPPPPPPPPIVHNYAMIENNNNNNLINHAVADPRVSIPRVSIDVERGEIEDGEVELMNDMMIVDVDDESDGTERVVDRMKKLCVMKKQLEMCLKFRVSLDRLCSCLMNLGFRLTRLIPDVCDGEKQVLIGLFFAAVEKAKSVYLSVDQNTVRDRDRDALHRLLTHATALRPLYASLQVLEKGKTSSATETSAKMLSNTYGSDTMNVDGGKDVASYMQNFRRSWMYDENGDLPAPTCLDSYGSGGVVVEDVSSYRNNYERSWMYGNGYLPSPRRVDAENGCLVSLTPAQEAILEPIGEVLKQAAANGDLELGIKVLKDAANGCLPSPTPKLLKRKTVQELGPELKRQRNDSSSDESGKARAGACDPRGDLRKVAAKIGSKAVANNQPKVNALITPGNSSKLGTMSTTKPEDISANELFTNNSRNTTDTVNSGNLKKKTSFACEQVKGGPVQPRKADAWSDVEYFLDGFNEQQKAEIRTERARRLEEQKKLFSERKLSLVLDLDHTLLHSVKFDEVDPMHHGLLRKKEEQERGKLERHLFQVPHMGLWTKMRPGIWKFLEKASKLFELHIYTMGNRCYATEMAKLLDPKGELFGGRVMARGADGKQPLDDDDVPKTKDMEGVLGMESSVVIVDDTTCVWPHNIPNLINVERYIYFPSSRRQLGLPGQSLLEIDRDESQEDGTLSSVSALIERVHENFFAHDSLDEADARDILSSEQRKILAGCRILFSTIIPIGEANPNQNSLWQTAERFGAVCTNQIDDQVTHVVAKALGTEKVNWALSNGRFVVHPSWVEASAFLYKRANERDFPIKQQK